MFYNIEFLRIVFTLIVICYHFIRKMGYWNQGGYAVEFFFILSGVFLFIHLKNNKDESCYHFLFQKIKRFFPYIFLSVVYKIVWKLYIDEPVTLLPILNSLTFSPTISSLMVIVAWYINILLWVSCFFFVLYQTCLLKTANLVTGILFFTSFYILQQIDFLSFARLGSKGSVGYFIQGGLLRGICGIGCGILLAQLIEKRTIVQRKTSVVLYTILECMCLIYPVAAMLHKTFYMDPKFIFISFIPLIYLFFIKKGALSRLLDAPIFGWGVAFWILPVYLCQEVVVSDIFPFIWNKYPFLHTYHAIVIGGTYVATIGVGILSCYIVKILNKRIISNRDN